MRISWEQRRVCRRFGVRGVAPGGGSMVGLALSRGPEVLPLNAVRHLPVGASNGWYVWRGEADPADDGFYSPLHVEHLSDHAPELIPYLALPPGWAVVLAPGYEDVYFDEDLLTE
ncbi:hypothetical protein ACGFJ7_37940 [Actinoplanes sp. NPDC048988]|uniref:immunity protein Imm33 domain-containing protein n=1 Tax=Actinoplanes sp. NPDC048988 TaxID=3363901 RepID=UPI003720B9D3